MARPTNQDYFHSFRFWAKAVISGNDQFKATAGPGGVTAGFQAVTVPEYTIDPVEYREGHHTFTKKYPGLVTVAECTFSRGVVLRDTAFLAWLLQTAVGGEDYRADVTIYHFHRQCNPTVDPAQLGAMIPVGNSAPEPHRTYTLLEAFPVRCKPAGDLDSMTADVSIAEADVAYEYFNVEDKIS